MTAYQRHKLQGNILLQPEHKSIYLNSQNFEKTMIKVTSHNFLFHVFRNMGMRPHALSKCSTDQPSQRLEDSTVRLCESGSVLTHQAVCTFVYVERLSSICVKYTRQLCRQYCTMKQETRRNMTFGHCKVFFCVHSFFEKFHRQ